MVPYILIIRKPFSVVFSAFPLMLAPMEEIVEFAAFANSAMGKELLKNTLDLPEDKSLPGTNEILPHIFAGDEDFSLNKHLMRPYPGNGI
nr:unnamed protein product [Callosobruchus analis]